MLQRSNPKHRFDSDPATLAPIDAASRRRTIAWGANTVRTRRTTTLKIEEIRLRRLLHESRDGDLTQVQADQVIVSTGVLAGSAGGMLDAARRITGHERKAHSVMRNSASLANLQTSLHAFGGHPAAAFAHGAAGIMQMLQSGLPEVKWIAEHWRRLMAIAHKEFKAEPTGKMGRLDMSIFEFAGLLVRAVERSPDMAAEIAETKRLHPDDVWLDDEAIAVFETPKLLSEIATAYRRTTRRGANGVRIMDAEMTDEVLSLLSRSPIGRKVMSAAASVVLDRRSADRTLLDGSMTRRFTGRRAADERESALERAGATEAAIRRVCVSDWELDSQTADDITTAVVDAVSSDTDRAISVLSSAQRSSTSERDIGQALT